MILKQDDFIMECSDDEYKPIWFWDLSLLVTINEGKKNARDEIKLDGYACTTERCIERISQNRASRNVKEDPDLDFKIELEKETQIIKSYLETIPDIRLEKPLFPQYENNIRKKRSTPRKRK